MIRLFISDDAKEARRLDRSLDMAIALFEIVNNAHRHKETVEEYQKRIIEIMDEQNLDIDDLIE
jgi:anti-sigma regulatory factor (Ser/Thr protein kinase)